MLHVINIIQQSKYRWKVISPKGHVIMEELFLANIHDAKEWAKSYVSSFQGWTFKLIIKGEKNDN